MMRRVMLGATAGGLALVMAGCSTPDASPPDVVALVATQPCEEPLSAAPRASLREVTPVSLMLCEIPARDPAGPDGSIIPTNQSSLLAVLTDDQAKQAVRVLATTPDDPAGPCAAERSSYVAPIFLRLSNGRFVRPSIPVDRCGQPVDDLRPLLDSLTYGEWAPPATWP